MQCSITPCTDYAEDDTDPALCGYHAYRALSETDRKRYDYAEDAAHFHSETGDVVEDFCRVCSRVTDHRGEHTVQQYLDWLAKQNQCGLELDAPPREFPADWPTAEDRMLMAIFGPTDEQRAELRRRFPVIPTPADIAKRKRQARTYRSLDMKNSGIYRTETPR